MDVAADLGGMGRFPQSLNSTPRILALRARQPSSGLLAVHVSCSSVAASIAFGDGGDNVQCKNIVRGQMNLVLETDQNAMVFQ